MATHFVFLVCTSDQVVLDRDRVWADGEFDDHVVQLHKEVCNLYKNSDIEIDRSIVFTDGKALIMARGRNQRNPSDDGVHVAADLCQTIEATTQRLLRAHQDQIPLSEIPHAKAIWRTNRVAWSIAQRGSTMVFLPETPHQMTYNPVDPQSLPRTSRPVHEFTVEIGDREVVGCRCAGGPQAEMFVGDDLSEVIISLRGNHPEIAARMPVAEAQDLWRGTTTITTTIQIAGNGLPRVVGRILVTRK